MFRAVPLSIIRSFSLYIQQWYMSYGFAELASRFSSVLILLAICQQTCVYCCVYREKLLKMDRGTARNMQNFIPKINLRNYTPRLRFLYIQSTNIFNQFFLDFLSPSSFIPPQNVVYFLMLPFLVHKIFTFYINGVLNCKCPAPGSKG